jgi:replicative DNA helicase
MAKVIKNTLGYLGIDFQYKLIAAFFERPKFFKDLYPIIDQNMFTESYLKTIVGVMKEYYAKHDNTVSYETISMLLRDKSYTTEDVQCFDEAVEKLRSLSTEGIDEVEDMAEKFFKQQNWIRVANEIRRVAGDGDMSKYDECQALIEQANSIGRKTEESSSPYDNLEDDLSKESVVTIPTGIKTLDVCLGGGLDKGKIGLLMGPTSFGKVQPYDSIVMTPEGPTEMKNIKVGSWVIGKDGKSHKVIGVYPHKDWEFYKVTFSDGVSCECGMEHLWAVNSQNQRNDYDSSFKVMSLEEIVGKGLFSYGHRHNFKIPMTDKVNFAAQSVAINPYLMGYMIGNGDFSKVAITVVKEDEEDVVGDISNLGEDFFVKHFKNRTASIVFNNEFKCKLLGYFGASLTSEEKYIPKEYLYNSIATRIDILNGLMDSNGTCHKNGSTCFNTKSLQLANDIRTLVFSLGGFAKVKETKNDCDVHYEVTITFCDESIQIFRLKHKQDRVKYSKNANRFFEKVEYSRKADGQCIKIDSDDELYLTDNFIVTHNTSMTTGIAAYAATFRDTNNRNKGYKVLQIVFEDSPRDIHRKYFSRLTQVETCKINENEETTSFVRDTLKNHPDKELIKNNIQVMQLSTGEYSATDIKRVIKKKINEGFKPDMVIVDYFECIKCEKGTGNAPKHEQETLTMRKFENMAKELDIALWIPTQGNRSSVTSELVTMDQGAGAFTKQQIAQVVISIARSVEDVKNQRATLAVLKNRSGSAGTVLQGIMFNNGTCTIISDNVTTFDNTLEFKEYTENESMAKKFSGYI